MGLFSKKKKPTAVKADGDQSRNKSFYLRENQITAVSDFYRMLNYEPEKGAFVGKINTEIGLAGIPISQLSPDKLINEMDSPSFVLDNSENIPGHIIYFYRQNTDLIKFLIQIHFVQDKCVFINNKISATGITLTDNDKKKVVEKLFKKYNIDGKLEDENFAIYLTDRNGNKLYSTDSVHFYLNYAANKDSVDYVRHLLDNYHPDEEAEDGFGEALDQLL